MVCIAPKEAYQRILSYGEEKYKNRIDKLFIQAFCAGFFVGLASHCSLNLGSRFTVNDYFSL